MDDLGEIHNDQDQNRITIDASRRDLEWLRALLEQRLTYLEVLVENRFKERDERFNQIEIMLKERCIRIAALESQSALFNTILTTSEAKREGGWAVIPTIIGLISLVVGSVVGLIVHLWSGK